MDFSDPPRRNPAENLLPMINVVFLLLVFFLITARMAPPEPFAVDLPETQADPAEADGRFVLFLSADGVPGYRDLSGDAALAALDSARADWCRVADCRAAPPGLTLRADARLVVADLAALLPGLTARGFGRIDLVTRQGAP